MNITQLEQRIKSFEYPAEKFTATLDNLPLIAAEIETAEIELARLAFINENIYKQLKQLPVHKLTKLRLAFRLESNREKIRQSVTFLETLADAVETILSAFNI